MCKKFFVLRRTRQDTIKSVYWSSCEVPVMLLRFLIQLELSGCISKNAQISNFIHICLVGAELLHSDIRTGGQTDKRDEDDSLFPNFAKAPKE
jgi:hypothetical protein